MLLPRFDFIPHLTLPTYTRADFDRLDAERWGGLAVQDIQRCLRATYCHKSREERATLLERDERTAVAIAKIAWRYALRSEEVR